MNRSRKGLIIASLVCAIIFSFAAICPVYADDDGSSNDVGTVLWGNVEDDGNGCGVYLILNFVLDFLSYGVAIVAVISIVAFGIQYMTAGGNEQQVIKAKKRIVQILIGVAAYATMYAGINFLLPGGKLNSGTECTFSESSDSSGGGGSGGSNGSNGSSNSNNSNKKNKNKNNSASYKNKSYYKTCMKKALIKSESVRESICKYEKGSERIARTAELLAAKSKKASVQCYPLTQKFSKWSQFKKCAPTKYFQYAYDQLRPGHWKKYSKYVKNVVMTGASCDYFVATVINASGYDKVGLSHSSIQKNGTQDKKKWKKVKKASRGDICQYLSNGAGHVKIFLGHKKIAEASSGLKSGDKRWGGVTSGSCGSNYSVYHAIK